MNCERKHDNPFENMHGKSAEKLALGVSQIALEEKDDLAKLYARCKDLNTETALDIARKFREDLQEKYPRQQAKDMLIEHYFETQERCPVKHSEWIDAILSELQDAGNTDFESHFITAIDSAYDILWGVDGLFLFENKENPNESFYVTIDFTLNKEKEIKDADLIVGAELAEVPEKVAMRVQHEFELAKARNDFHHKVSNLGVLQHTEDVTLPAAQILDIDVSRDPSRGTLGANVTILDAFKRQQKKKAQANLQRQRVNNQVRWSH